jgi:hypothetical protein
MIKSPRHSFVSLVCWALAGWIALLTVWAFYLFVIPHDAHFAPEVGRSGLFIIIGGIASACYLGGFIFIAVPIHFVLRSRCARRYA